VSDDTNTGTVLPFEDDGSANMFDAKIDNHIAFETTNGGKIHIGFATMPDDGPGEPGERAFVLVFPTGQSVGLSLDTFRRLFSGMMIVAAKEEGLGTEFLVTELADIGAGALTEDGQRLGIPQDASLACLARDLNYLADTYPGGKYNGTPVECTIRMHVSYVDDTGQRILLPLRPLPDGEEGVWA
jgi:hypothetical protein